MWARARYIHRTSKFKYFIFCLRIFGTGICVYVFVDKRILKVTDRLERITLFKQASKPEKWENQQTELKTCFRLKTQFSGGGGGLEKHHHQAANMKNWILYSVAPCTKGAPVIKSLIFILLSCCFHYMVGAVLIISSPPHTHTRSLLSIWWHFLGPTYLGPLPFPLSPCSGPAPSLCLLLLLFYCTQHNFIFSFQVQTKNFSRIFSLGNRFLSMLRNYRRKEGREKEKKEKKERKIYIKIHDK